VLIEVQSQYNKPVGESNQGILGFIAAGGGGIVAG